MTGRYDMWNGTAEETVVVPTSGGENVMVPVVRGIVRSVQDRDLIILQRRDDPDESVRGSLEIPGGRWHAGESPADALRREIAEETGLEVVAIDGVDVEALDDRRSMATTRPLAVVSGVSGAFPAVHMILVVDATGEPRPEPGETAEVQWWLATEIRAALRAERSQFVPSTHAALNAYFSFIDGRRFEG